MSSSTLKVIGCVIVLCLVVHAQNPQKTRPGSISGKVTLKGNGAAGIIVGARDAGRASAALTATTDGQGNYRIANVGPGQYEVWLAAPQYALGNSGKRLIIAEGENLENVDFTILRAGVITGKVTDADGRPVIEVPVEVFGPEARPGPPMSMMKSISTDDRGIYRIYGLAPGKYRVAAGVQEDQMYYYGRFRSAVYSQTFYPSTNESAKATLVEVTEGGETTNVDIIVRRIPQLFTVTARVIDADSGQPVPEATYGVQRFRENGSFSTSHLPSNKLGEIKLENITPGKYALFLDPSPLRDIYAEPVRFEVIDQDIKDLVIKASSGSGVSGVVVFEGMDEKAARTKFVGLGVAAHSMSRNADSIDGGGMAPTGPVSPDGSFRLGGLRPGTLSFSIWGQRSGPMNEFEVARVERDGVVQPNIEIKTGEQINGLRLIVRSRSGRIRGILKFENGEIPFSRVLISAKKVDDENFERSLELDDRGRFMSDALAAGLYEVRVLAYVTRGRPPQIKQQVVVTNNQVIEVTMTLDLKADAGQGRP